MAEHSPIDPMDWDLERVVKELCTPDRTWRASSSTPALPPLEQLEASLRNNFVDGECLLTDSDQVDFFQDLGVKAIKHKSTLRTAIDQFRRRSLKYRLRQHVKEEADTPEFVIDHNVTDLDPEARKRKLMAERASPEPNTSLQPAHGARGTPVSPISTPRSIDQEVSTAPAESSEPLRKKRRIAPVLITADVDMSLARNIPTEADVISGLVGDAVPDLQDSHLHSSAAYLGADALTRVDLIEYEPQSSDQSLSSEDQEYQFLPHKAIPIGRHLQVNKFFKRRFSAPRVRTTLRPYKADTVPGADDPDHNDVIIAAFGDSGTEEEYDSDTWAEIEAEQRERDATGATPSSMTQDEINAIIDEAITDYISIWKERKLPKLVRDEYQIWHGARRSGLKSAIGKEKRDLVTYEARLNKYRENIVDQEWHKPAHVKLVTGTLEATVQDREKALWKLGVLKSPLEPKKLPGPPRQTGGAHREPRSQPKVDEEILTSDSEDSDPGEFIVDDNSDLPAEAAEEQDVLITEIADNADDDPDYTDATDVDESDTTETDEEAHADGTVDDDVDELFDSQPVESLDLSTHPPVTDGVGSSPQSQRRPSPEEALQPKTPSKKAPPSNNEHAGFQGLEVETPIGLEELFTAGFLDSLKHNELLTLTKFANLSHDLRLQVMTIASDSRWPIEERWRHYMLRPLNSSQFPRRITDNKDEQDLFLGFIMLSLFDIFTDAKVRPWSEYKHMTDEHKQAVRAKERRLTDLFWLLRKAKAIQGVGMSSRSERAKSSPYQVRGSSQSAVPESKPNTPSKTASHVKDSRELLEVTPSKKKRTLVRDQNAQNLRDSTRLRMQEQDARRMVLRAQMLASGSTSASQKSRLIINESKEDDQGLIFVHDNIADRIKDHQISGVRFMWNQIVMDSQAKQGCLLAHTMGLGKTMQIITLLLAIYDAAVSDDESISSQIPEDLKISRTLILVPGSLVNNWLDEFLIWAPENHNLGAFHKIDREYSEDDRAEIVQDWATSGGILIVGYELFLRLAKVSTLTDHLLDGPNIVIADEAHKLKNTSTEIHKVTARFRTHSRIGLTGSPLANNVLEYHSLINWVAPNFLSDLREFRQDYATPIEMGLGADSIPSDRRRALTKLRALRETVAPKVHRRTIAVLKDDLPPKFEFVLSVPLTDMQHKAYTEFMQNQNVFKETTKVFSALSILRLLCAHPLCFRAKLEEEKKVKEKEREREKEQGQESPAGEDAVGEDVLPLQLTSDLLTLIPQQGLAEDTLSWKIPLLTKVLDESKRLGDRVLVFSQSIHTIDYLVSLFRRQRRSLMRIDGSTKTTERQGMVKKFNQSDIDIFIISTTAGGMGLNITGANRVVIFDMRFNPQSEQQAVGRAYRIGQKKPVYVYRFICGGTFEEKLQNKAVFKMQLASRVVDTKNPIPKSQRFEDLLDMPSDPKQEDLTPYRGRDKVLDSILDSENLTGCLRSIVMTETFEEEESVDDKALTQEEELQVQQLLAENNARRTGQPLANTAFPSSNFGAPPSLSATSGGPTDPATNMTGQQSAVQADGAVPEQSVVLTGGDLPTSSASQLPPPDQSSLHNQSTYGNGPLQPILGATTQSRSPMGQHSSDASVGSVNRSLAYKQELSRALKDKDVIDAAGAKSIVLAIADAFEKQSGLRKDEVIHRAEWAVVEAAKSARFVEALVRGRLTAKQLSEMEPDSIAAQQRQYDETPEDQWRSEMAAEHSEPALEPEPPRHTNHTPSFSEAVHTIPRMSRRADDHAALQAVFQRREANKQGLSMPRLPAWALEAVASQGGLTPSSSTSPAPPSSSAPRRHTARDPFR